MGNWKRAPDINRAYLWDSNRSEQVGPACQCKHTRYYTDIRSWIFISDTGERYSVSDKCPVCGERLIEDSNT